MNIEDIYNGEEYFDANRLISLREKLSSNQQYSVLQKVIQKCISLSKKYNIIENIKDANVNLLELAKDPETTPEQFQEAANRLKVEIGYDIWIRMS